MAQQTINLGTAGTNSGDTVRDAFDKCNDNFNDTYKKGDGGFFESTDRIKLHPGEFLPNSDSSTSNVGHVSNGGSCKVMSSSLEMIGYCYIPIGYKATEYQVYGTQFKTVNIYVGNINTQSVSSKGQGITNVVVNMTDVTATSTNYLSIKVTTTSTNDRIYGAYVKIVAV